MTGVQGSAPQGAGAPDPSPAWARGRPDQCVERGHLTEPGSETGGEPKGRRRRCGAQRPGDPVLSVLVPRCFSPCTSATTSSTSQRCPSPRKRCAETWWTCARSPARASATWPRCGAAQVGGALRSRGGWAAAEGRALVRPPAEKPQRSVSAGRARSRPLRGGEEFSLFSFSAPRGRRRSGTGGERTGSCSPGWKLWRGAPE